MPYNLPMDRFRQITWVQYRKEYIIAFFVCVWVIFCVAKHFFEPRSLHNYPIVGNVEGARSVSRRVIASTLWDSDPGVCEVIFARPLRTTDGISCRLKVVWVLFLPKYSKCCTFLLNNPNIKPIYGEHLIFISRKGN